MPRTSVDDLTALIAVAREEGFTNAAANLGVSQSALSQTVRELELGVDDTPGVDSPPRPQPANQWAMNCLPATSPTMNAIMLKRSRICEGRTGIAMPITK